MPAAVVQLRGPAPQQRRLGLVLEPPSSHSRCVSEHLARRQAPGTRSPVRKARRGGRERRPLEHFRHVEITKAATATRETILSGDPSTREPRPRQGCSSHAVSRRRQSSGGQLPAGPSSPALAQGSAAHNARLALPAAHAPQKPQLPESGGDGIGSPPGAPIRDRRRVARVPTMCRKRSPVPVFQQPSQ